LKIFSWQAFGLGRPYNAKPELGVDYKIALVEQMPPGSIVRLDITKPVFTHLRNLGAAYADQAAVYRSSLNVILLPQESDTALPIQSPQQRDKDRRLLTVEYVPSVLKSEAIGRHIDSLKGDNPVYPGG
jgi:hypothetical protein